MTELSDKHNMTTMERLQKFMARRGIGSRRKCEEIILAGRVKVNGKKVIEMGQKIDPLSDVVEVDGKRLEKNIRYHYIAMNKPVGYITACSDKHNPNLITTLLPERLLKEGVVPVGRLDKNTSGLILFTNDGDLAFRLTHPKYSIVKTYFVAVKGNPDDEAYNRLQKGIFIDNKMTSPAEVKEIKRERNHTTFNLSIHEGRHHQVRRMCKEVGHPVLHLTRIRIGPISLGTLRKGKWRPLSATEIEKLKTSVKITN